MTLGQSRVLPQLGFPINVKLGDACSSSEKEGHHGECEEI